jgi:hypothetical protein
MPSRHHLILGASLVGAALLAGVAVRSVMLRLDAPAASRLDQGWIKVDAALTLPPAPDPVRNGATLVGVDVNTNGVRDDVERTIAAAHGLHSERAEALRQTAVTVQMAIANGGQVWLARDQGRAPVVNADDLKRMLEQSTLAGACVLKTFGADYGDAGRRAGEAALHQVVTALLDTPQRQYAYAQARLPTHSDAGPPQQPLFFLNPCDGLLRSLRESAQSAAAR